MKKLLTLILSVCILLTAASAFAEEADQSTPVLTEAGMDRTLYPWGEYLTETDLVSQDNNAAIKEKYKPNLDLFDEYTYNTGDETIGTLTYYLYDPTQHGFAADGEYPVALWLHGGGNAAQGKLGVLLCGAAGFAGEERQQKLGGMYILYPVANPELNSGRWSADYASILIKLLSAVKQEKSITGKNVLLGQSMGGFMVNWLMEADPTMPNIVMWINTTPASPEKVKSFSDAGIVMWAENGIHDETISFNDTNAKYCAYPNGTEAYDGIENFTVTILEWIRNGDKTISSINYGGTPASESGQHCSCLQLNRDLIFDDGTPDDPNLPDGVSGWLKNALDKVNGR